MADHPNKHIRDALEYAEEHGWTIRKSGPRAHAWGVIFCSFGHRVCWMAVYSTPRNPEIMHGTFGTPWTGALVRNRRT